MAEVQNLATSTAADIPIASGGITSGNLVESSVTDAANVSTELGTSPTQERSSNSHPHDSEYDTASDLEGGEEYDDDDDEDDLETDEEDDEEDEEDDVDNDTEALSTEGVESLEKASELEIQKKVDEDRSNPQYIPKRGTFYEHDDRMADGENGGVLQIGESEGAEAGGKAAVKASAQSPSISYASKTMKKFQPASANDRWTHDRFDPSEQNPKSDAEIINQYGFNMRKESNPPKARRRRRYTRGPNKYDRKWEDENAYIKSNTNTNKERKPPRASDFPALSERGARKQRRGSRELNDDGRDEKENLPDRQRNSGGAKKTSVKDRLNFSAPRSNNSDDRRDRDDGRSKTGGKSAVQSRLIAGNGRRPPMEFKQKFRSVRPSPSHQTNNSQNNSRADDRFDRQNQRFSQNQSNYDLEEHHQQKHPIKNSPQMKQNQSMQGDAYNNNSSSNSQHANASVKLHEQHNYPQHQHQMPSSLQQQQMNVGQIRQAMPVKSTPPPSNLSQRLQQVQNRNDPSHVGSVQMHALATQNQQQQQQQLVMGPQTNTNAMVMSTVPQQQAHSVMQQSQPQEQRGPPKRYSSMRRSQHDTQHISDGHSHPQQQLQHLHMQQPPPPQQAQPTPQALMMQDQHSILQANLLQQFYHQENLQAQMQALQVSQTSTAPQAKPAAYATVPATAGQTAPPSQAYGANPGNTAYFVADAYGAATSNPPAPPPPTQFAPQPSAFLAPTQPNAAALSYTTQPQSAQAPIPSGPPANVYAGPQNAPNTNQNFSNYQNFNTVGGTTYFVPPASATNRPVTLPQRRPTNAIPILPPAEKNKQRGNEPLKDDTAKSIPVAQMDSGENIDHIIDNMFVQRPVFQPPVAVATHTTSNAEAVNSSATGDSQTASLGGEDSDASINNLNASSANTATESSAVSVTPSGELATNCNAAPSENSNNNSIVTQE